MKKTAELSSYISNFSKAQKIALVILSILFIGLEVFFTVVLSGGSFATIKTTREYRAGELSDENVYAPYDYSYIDEVETEKKYNAATKSILPQFTYSVADTIYMRGLAAELVERAEEGKSIDAFYREKDILDPFYFGRRLDDLPTEDRMLIARLTEEGLSQLVVSGMADDDEVKMILQEGNDFSQVESSVGYDLDTEKNIVETGDIFILSDITEFVAEWLAKSYNKLTVNYVGYITESIKMLAKANIHYDAAYTNVLKEEARGKVEPVVVEIKKGDQILKIDTIVTDSQLRTIERYQTFESYKISASKVIAYTFFMTFALLCFYYFFFTTIAYKYRLGTYSILIMSFIILSLGAGFMRSYFLLKNNVTYLDPFLPFYAAGLLASYITGKKRVGFSVCAMIVISYKLWPVSNTYSFIYFLLIALVALLLSNIGQNRIDLILQCVATAGISALITLVLGMMYSFDIVTIIFSMLTTVGNIVITYIMITIVLPVLEIMFNIPTSFRLHELSFADSPALNRLNQVAQGTFNHVKNVADLSYAAAKAIGANADLARVGALYHDIGKSEHPEYFIENQNGKNAHDDISFALSAAIIKSHVKLGVEKAKEIGLPQEVIDIIGEHHGNDLIKYFYNEAVKNSKEKASFVSEEDFRYTGKVPSTRESAIVMLADCSEAATRTLKNPTHQKYDKFIQSIIVDKINYKQLDNSMLTINDLKVIKDAFIQLLVGRDHQRIEYNNNKD